MYVKFNLYRSSLHPETGRILGTDYLWQLEMRFTPQSQDLTDFYVQDVGFERRFAYLGVGFNDLAKVVFGRRKEFLSYVGVAEYFFETSGSDIDSSKLHCAKGLRAQAWFSNLLDALGRLENYSKAR